MRWTLLVELTLFWSAAYVADQRSGSELIGVAYALGGGAAAIGLLLIAARRSLARRRHLLVLVFRPFVAVAELIVLDGWVERFLRWRKSRSSRRQHRPTHAAA